VEDRLTLATGAEARGFSFNGSIPRFPVLLRSPAIDRGRDIDGTTNRAIALSLKRMQSCLE